MNTEKLKKALEELVTLIEQADTFEWRGTYIGYIEESKDRAKELLAAPPSSPTGTAEKEELFEILRKLGFNVSPFAVKEIPIVLKCMTEYASLKEQEARSRMIRVVQSRLNSVKINLIDAPKSEYLKGQKVAYQEVLDFLEDKPY